MASSVEPGDSLQPHQASVALMALPAPLVSEEPPLPALLARCEAHLVSGI